MLSKVPQDLVGPHLVFLHLDDGQWMIGMSIHHVLTRGESISFSLYLLVKSFLTIAYVNFSGRRIPSAHSYPVTIIADNIHNFTE